VTVELRRADTVVLYTDGVTEQSPDLDFDEAELGRLMRNRIGPADPEAVAQLILDTVLLLAPGKPRDDLAVLVACVTAG
jgi:serine phosphatase RsbU (regulator of sigma subunit)